MQATRTGSKGLEHLTYAVRPGYELHERLIIRGCVFSIQACPNEPLYISDERIQASNNTEQHTLSGSTS